MTLKICMVEDHPDSREMIKYYFESRGHDVYVAGNVAEALNVLKSHPCDLLISDVGLPDGTGWELRDRAGLDDSTYTVTMSGFGTKLDRERSANAGYQQHIVKPINPGTLDDIIASAVERQSHRDD